MDKPLTVAEREYSKNNNNISVAPSSSVGNMCETEPPLEATEEAIMAVDLPGADRPDDAREQQPTATAPAPNKPADVGASSGEIAGEGHRSSQREGEAEREGLDAAQHPGNEEGEERATPAAVAWLSLRKQAAEGRCAQLEAELAEARDAVSKHEASVRVAQEKIRHLEAESQGFLAAAEFREREACSIQEGVDLAEERAHAHEKALASALEQLSDSGVSQSKKLVEFASVVEELKRTKASLERAERLVFEQRQEADERQMDEDRRREETDALRIKLAQVERKNTELMAKHAAGRLAKRMRGNFGRSSTFCASFCSCFRGRPAYRRVSSPGRLATPAGTSDSSPWLG